MITDSPNDRTESDAPDLMRVVKLALRWWPALVVAAVAAAGVTAIVASRGENVYEAQVRILVGPVDGEFNILRAAGQQAQTLSQLATSRPVLSATRRLLDREVDANDIAARGDDVTRVLTITVRDASQRDSARIANTVAAELIGLLEGGGPRTGGRATRVVDPALAPAEPVARALATLVAMAGITGLLVAIAVLLVVDYFRGRIATEIELGEVSGLPVLGTVGWPSKRPGALAFDGTPTRAGATGERPESEFEAAAAYRVLAGRIALADPERPPRSVLVAGAERGDAGAEVAANLAAALAGGGARVVLVDADPSVAAITHMFGLGGHPGLSELLAEPARDKRGELAPELAIELRPRLWVVPRGGGHGHDLLDASRGARVLAGLLEHSDMVVVNVGSTASAPGAVGWSRLVEGCVVLATRTRTRRDAVAATVDVFAQVGATLLGTVMVERRRRRDTRAAARRARSDTERQTNDPSPRPRLRRSDPTTSAPESVGRPRS